MPLKIDSEKAYKIKGIRAYQRFSNHMTPEILHIHDHAIPYEIYESELKLNRRDKNPITLLSFVFKGLPWPLADEVAATLWVEVARKYLTLKKRFRDISPEQVIGRISFQCDGAKVEFEFSQLTKSSLLNLIRIGQFVRQYPHSEEIRILRDGRILVRFRRPEDAPTPSGTSDNDAGSRLRSWLLETGSTVLHFGRRKAETSRKS